jgi:hypothetical protein
VHRRGNARRNRAFLRRTPDYEQPLFVNSGADPMQQPIGIIAAVNTRHETLPVSRAWLRD